MRPGTATVFAALALLAMAEPSLAVSPGAVRLQPHVAVYDLSLLKARSRAGISGVNGRLAIEVSGSECEDWTVNFRMVSQFQTEDQSTRLLDTQSSTWESGDGKALNVSQRHFVDSSLDSESKVSVSKDANGRTHGTLDKPKAQEFELAVDTIFPVKHLQRLLDAAEQGRHTDKSAVFDGTEGTKSYTAITFIGRPRQQGHKTDLHSLGGEQLKSVKAWPTMISYYDQAQSKNNEGIPSYEVSVEMFENGVSGDMAIDYGDYSLNAKLAKLELKPYGTCQ
ncbi:MAG TPA: cell envelope integrity EipB family protein [Aestuariivirgaceae bacterium]